jgi:DNA-directed RNA polymerase specialized sigma24 family protein
MQDSNVLSYEFETSLDDDETYIELLRPLNQKERDIVILRLTVGLTLTEISREMNLPKGSVFWTYNNAMKKLKKLHTQ